MTEETERRAAHRWYRLRDQIDEIDRTSWPLGKSWGWTKSRHRRRKELMRQLRQAAQVREDFFMGRSL